MAKPYSFPMYRTLCISSAAAILTLIALWTSTEPWHTFLPGLTGQAFTNMKTFYDDPNTHYTIDKPMTNWDEKRRNWIKNHPMFPSNKNSVLLVTGSQPSPCKNPIGDHLLLRFFKNKVDYCRIHGYQIFYNDALLDPKMGSFWAKIPVIRAAMLAHPEVDWIFWVDSDAAFTDMELKIPFERYEDHNMVVHGWPDLIYDKKSWVAVNAGVFLIRNCQWAMDFLEVWAGMGPKSPNYHKWGEILKSTLKDKLFEGSDDQSALIYLLLKGGKKWRDKIYVENQYALHGYWLAIVDKFDGIGDEYTKMEKRVRKMRRRHAEVVTESYAVERERYTVADSGWQQRRRPFVTHFTGCQPCSGKYNPVYEGDSCLVGMERALNFADNQVLRNYGFVHPDVGNGSLVMPLPFDFDQGR